VLSASTDSAWHLLDIDRMACVISSSPADSSASTATVSGDVSNSRLTTAQFHPDGLLLGTATSDGKLRIWDIREQKNVVTLGNQTGSAEQVMQTMSFSENGYYIGVGYEHGLAQVWDLRKQVLAREFEGEL
jgi:pre-mRNA-processing factor 19